MTDPTPRPLTFEDVYDRFAPRTWRALRWLGVAERHREDVFAEVFMVVHRRLPEVTDHDRLGAWIVGIARKIAADQRRRDQREPLMDDEMDRNSGRPEPSDPEARIADRDLVLRLLSTLTPERRDVFVLHELEGLTIAETATALSIPEGTAATRFRLAKVDLEAAQARMQARDRHRAMLPLAALLEAERRELPPLPDGVQERVWKRLQRVQDAPPATLAKPSHGGPILGAGLGLVLGLVTGALWDPRPRAPDVEVIPIYLPVFASASAVAAEPQPPEVKMETTAPSASASAAPGSDIAAERALMDKVRRALVAGETARAFAALEEHARRFPAGRLADEREASWILTLVRAGRTPEARARFDRYARAFPGSSRLAELRRALGEDPPSP